jgi:hypothetical protein
LSRLTTSESRLSCRISKDLLNWVKWYAKQKRTTVTAIVVGRFQELKDSHESDSMNEVDQL